MKIKLKIMNLIWEAKSPIHIGCGRSIGNMHLTLDHVPGTAIKGALGRNYLKLFCINNEFAICSKGGKCDKCEFPSLFLNDFHGSGIYFQTLIPQEFKLEEQYSVTIDIDTRSNKKGQLFNYQKMVILNKNNSTKIIFTENLSNEVVEKITEALSLDLYVGSRKSWGWGIIKMEKIGMDDFELSDSNEETSDRKYHIELKNHLPITEKNIGETITRGLSDLASGFKITSYQDFSSIKYTRYEIEPIGVRSDINDEVIRKWAVIPPVNIELVGSAKNEIIIKLSQIIGLTTNNNPWTKTGYGLIK